MEHTRTGDQLKIDRKTASRIVALGIGFIGCAFIAGYFMGKRQAVVHEMERIHKRAFADQITHAVEQGQLRILPGAHEHELGPALQQRMVHSPEVPEDKTTPAAEQDADAGTSSVAYYAHLLGGTKMAVEKFAGRMQARGVPIRVQKRTGSTVGGKRMVWYQASTQLYKTQEELHKVIQLIKKVEHIKDITIRVAEPAQKGTQT